MRKSIEFLHRGLAIFMASAVLITSPLGIKVSKAASDDKPEYVKEVVLSYGKTEEDARAWLNKNKYKIVKKNLHEGTGSGIISKKTNVVLMGYKVTTNPDEAIRDIAVMPMTGGFKVTDMETIVRAQQSTIDNSMERIAAEIEEYQDIKEAYDKDKEKYPYVERVYNLLNCFKEDDSEEGMGDFLLRDFATNSNKNDLEKVIIQSNPQVLGMVENIMGFANGEVKTTWVDKFVKDNEKKSFFDNMKSKMKTAKRAKNYIEEKYGDKFEFIKTDWIELQDKIKEAQDTTNDISKENKDKEVKAEDMLNYFDVTDKDVDVDKKNPSKKELAEALVKDAENKQHDAEASEYLNTISVMEYLSRFKYGDKTLLDFFLEKRDFEEGNDIYEVCGVLDAMTDAQRDSLGVNCNIYSAIHHAMTRDEDMWNASTNDYLDDFDKYIEDINSLSIYDGVNRKIFDGDVAVTSVADRRTADIFNQSQSSLTGYIVSGCIGTVMLGFGISFIATGIKTLSNVASLTGSASSWYTARGMGPALNRALGNAIYGKEVINNLVDDLNFTTLSEIMDDVQKTGNLSEVNNVAKDAHQALRGYGHTVGNIVTIFGAAIAIAGIVLSVYGIFKLITTEIDKNEGDYSVDIPEFMVDSSVDTDGEETFIYYEAAKCNRNDSNMKGEKADNEGLKNFADINGDTGKFWLALYTTKDVAAGKPILAGTFEVMYGDTPYEDGYKQLHSFENSSTGLNLTSEEFNISDKNKGTYLRYKVDNKVAVKSDKKASDVGTLFGNSSKNTIVLVSGIAGLLIGFGLSALMGKRKKEEA